MPQQPKTWASTHARAGMPQGMRGHTFRKMSAAARLRERELELQELEKDLAPYSHRTPAGPSVASGSRFIEPCRADDAPQQTAVQRPGARLAPPSLAYTCNAEEADELLACLGPGPLGFDLEWKFCRRTGKSERTALLQICSSSLILILQISAMPQLPPTLRKVLHDPAIIKTGVQIRGDALKLQTDFGLRTRNIVELSAVAKLAQPAKWATTSTMISLRNLTRIYLGRRLDKSDVRVSNWEKAPLSAEQIEYAANDTFVSLEILRELCNYFPQAGGDVPLLKQLDGILLDKPVPKTVDLDTALRMSSFDLYKEHMDEKHVVQQRKEMAKTLREIRPNTAAKKTDEEDDITVTKVLLAHDRAAHKWLYSNQSLDQVAVASKIKVTTVGGYLVRALTEAQSSTSGIHTDFSTDDKLRLDREMEEAGEALATARKRYRDVANTLGWELPAPRAGDSSLHAISNQTGDNTR